jgi:hypothetical protein
VRAVITTGAAQVERVAEVIKVQAFGNRADCGLIRESRRTDDLPAARIEGPVARVCRAVPWPARSEIRTLRRGRSSGILIDPELEPLLRWTTVIATLCYVDPAQSGSATLRCLFLEVQALEP